MKLVLILGIMVLIEGAAIAILAAALGREKRAANALDPIDVMPVIRVKTDVKQTVGTGWEVVDDAIQYEDDIRAEKYREAWA